MRVYGKSISSSAPDRAGKHSDIRAWDYHSKSAEKPTCHLVAVGATEAGGHGQIIAVSLARAVLYHCATSKSPPLTCEEAMLSLTLALVVLDLALEVGETCSSEKLFMMVQVRAADETGVRVELRWAHAGTWLLLSLLGAADLALNIGAGGARVSLPLVLFAITECGYVFRMVLPWLHFVLASLVLMILLVVLLLPVLVRLTRAAPEWRVPWACKLAVGVYCGGALWRCRSASQGVGADLLSQLSSDALAMLTGTLLPVDSREALLASCFSYSAAQRRNVTGTATTFFPPILLFHWEAGADILLDRSNASATPYLRRPDVFSGSAIAGVPVTLKTAWEARTGQNAPRVLSRKLKTLFFVGCQHLPLPIFVSKDLD
ncbi:hypothetical protein AK812_SmicGene29400 [Symbiodinium microadriaticum]|uniref:Uncharacterized protein n=1 Tax=Symbiodinium microadriaticum TaxID=2951 RepID=A0A1Q9D1V0_SYMMI|nr:hypothetical protein AK812_SmicGene29400 [Symbiodinium microadriaticum]